MLAESQPQAFSVASSTAMSSALFKTFAERIRSDILPVTTLIISEESEV